MIPCCGRGREGFCNDHGRVCEVDVVGSDEGAEGELGVAHHGGADVREVGSVEHDGHGNAVFCMSSAVSERHFCCETNEKFSHKKATKLALFFRPNMASFIVFCENCINRYMSYECTVFEDIKQ